MVRCSYKEWAEGAMALVNQQTSCSVVVHVAIFGFLIICVQ